MAACPRHQDSHINPSKKTAEVKNPYCLYAVTVIVQFMWLPNVVTACGTMMTNHGRQPCNQSTKLFTKYVIV